MLLFEELQSLQTYSGKTLYLTHQKDERESLSHILLQSYYSK